VVDALCARTQTSFGVGAVEYRDSLLYVNTIYHSQWRNFPGEEGRITPGKLNVKAVPHITYISVLAFSWVSVGCCFCVFFGLFFGDLRF